MKLLCGKCGKECDASEIRICSDCGAFLCGDCGRTNNGLCPDCFGWLDKLS